MQIKVHILLCIGHIGSHCVILGHVILKGFVSERAYATLSRTKILIEYQNKYVFIHTYV